MSSRSSGVVLLAGLSAVAAGYFLVFRRKKKEVLGDKDTETIFIETAVEKSDEIKIGDENKVLEDSQTTYKSELTVNITLEEELEDKLSEDIDIGDSGEESLDSLEEDSSVRRKNESLMEWIDRQLKEAESKGLSSAKITEEEKVIVTNTASNVNSLEKQFGASESSIVDSILKENARNIEEDKDIAMNSIEIVSMTDSTFSSLPSAPNNTSDLSQSMVFVDVSQLSPDSDEIQLLKTNVNERESKVLVDSSESDSDNSDTDINVLESDKGNATKS